MNTERIFAIHGASFLVGGVVMAILLAKHPILGFIAGSSVGWLLATAITGVSPMKELIP